MIASVPTSITIPNPNLHDLRILQSLREHEISAPWIRRIRRTAILPCYLLRRDLRVAVPLIVIRRSVVSDFVILGSNSTPNCLGNSACVEHHTHFRFRHHGNPSRRVVEFHRDVAGVGVCLKIDLHRAEEERCRSSGTKVLGCSCSHHQNSDRLLKSECFQIRCSVIWSSIRR